MNLALIVNQTKPEAESFQKIIEEELAKKGISPKIFLNKDFSREDFVGMDCLITLGGDGTILHTTGVLQGMPVPILGINAGHLGYLTEIRQRRRIAEAIERLVAGDYVEDRRAMLSGSIFRQGKEIFSRSALNELLLSIVRSCATGWKWFTIPQTESSFPRLQVPPPIIFLREAPSFPRKRRYIS